MFDKMILPIITYASEIWGFEMYEPIERVQYQFCKFFLGVATNTTNVAVLGECGRHPLYVHYFVKCIGYWVKLIHMDNTRLPKASYNMLYLMDQNGKTNWVTKVKNLLFKYGFGYVFIMQEIGNSKLFMLNFKNRILDCSAQEWASNISDISKLKCYSSFKSMLDPEKYLLCIEIRRFKVAMSRFRCSNHCLEIETGRRENINLNDRLCKYCRSKGKLFIEDEYHFTCICDLYVDIRSKYIAYVKRYTVNDFVKLMKTNIVCQINELSKFIFHAMSKRNKYISSL
jgi:hypothetical protein